MESLQGQNKLPLLIMQPPPPPDPRRMTFPLTDTFKEFQYEGVRVPNGICVVCKFLLGPITTFHWFDRTGVRHTAKRELVEMAEVIDTATHSVIPEAVIACIARFVPMPLQVELIQQLRLMHCSVWVFMRT